MVSLVGATISLVVQLVLTPPSVYNVNRERLQSGLW